LHLLEDALARTVFPLQRIAIDTRHDALVAEPRHPTSTRIGRTRMTHTRVPPALLALAEGLVLGLPPERSHPIVTASVMLTAACASTSSPSPPWARRTNRHVACPQTARGEPDIAGPIFATGAARIWLQ
jgi:hypothetical protein